MSDDDDSLLLAIPPRTQGLIYLPGDNDALYLYDDDDAVLDNIRDFTPLMQAIMVARLRTWANQIEELGK